MSASDYQVGALKEAWPFDVLPTKTIEHEDMFFIDSTINGNTIAEFDNLVKAMLFMDKCSQNVVLRHYNPSQEKRDKVRSERRNRMRDEFTGPHKPLKMSHKDSDTANNHRVTKNHDRYAAMMNEV